MPKRPTDENEDDELPLEDEEAEERNDAFAVLDDEDEPSRGARRRDPLRRPQ